MSRLKCPKCKDRLFKAEETNDNLEIQCRKCGTVLVGFNKKQQEGKPQPVMPPTQPSPMPTQLSVD